MTLVPTDHRTTPPSQEDLKAAWEDDCFRLADHELDCRSGCPRRPCMTALGLRETERAAWRRYDASRGEAR